MFILKEPNMHSTATYIHGKLAYVCVGGGG